jgi:predicted transport protein
MPISKIEVQKHERRLPSNDNFNKLHSSEPKLAANIYNIGYEKYQL